MTTTKNDRFCGIVPPLVTPFKNDGSLDTASLYRIIDHIISNGVNGLFILGTTGEAPSLSHSLRKELISATCNYVKQRIPVLVGITDTSLGESAALADHAMHCGATAVVVSPPFYFPIRQEELLEYIQKLASLVNLPIYLYNMPNCTKTAYEINTLKQLTSISNIAGIKDSSGNMIYFKQLLQLKQIRPDWSIFIGPEELLAEAVFNGADGGVTGGANLFPDLYVNLYNAAAKRDSETIECLQQIVMGISENIYQPAYLPGLKYALSLKNLCAHTLAAPLNLTDENQKKQIEGFLQNFESDFPAVLKKYHSSKIIDMIHKQNSVSKSANSL